METEDNRSMRELIEGVVYEGFSAGLNELSPSFFRNTELATYLAPMGDMDWSERNEWLTSARLRNIKKLFGKLTNKQLLMVLTDQHCEKFR